MLDHIVILLIALYKQRVSMGRKTSLRNYLMVALMVGFFILLIIDTQNVLSTGQKAIELCLKVIIPSLFPFFILSRLIFNTGAIHIISRIFEPIVKPLFNLPGTAAFPIIAGWLSGYPAGAKYTADLYEKGMLTKSQAERLLCFCNNSGPLFIVGAVGTGYFNSPELGFILLMCHILGSLTVGIIQRFVFKDKLQPENLQVKDQTCKVTFSSQMLTESIADSINVLLQICGTIIFFAVFVQTLETAGIFDGVSNLISFLTKSDTSSFFRIITAGGFEITYGLSILSHSIIIPTNIKILLTSFLCGFGGVSVFIQVAGLCPKTIKLKKYVCGKLLHGAIASVYTLLFLSKRSIPTMNYSYEIYESGFSKAIIIVYILLLLFLIVYLIKLGFAKKKH